MYEGRGSRLSGGGWRRGEDRSSKIRNGPLRGAILGVLGMLRRHALAGSARGGAWRLPGRRIGRAGGAPGSLGARYGAVIRAARSYGSRGSRQGRQATGRARRAARPWVCGRSRGSAGRWDALRAHVAPGAGKPRRVGAGGAAPGTAGPLGWLGRTPDWLLGRGTSWDVMGLL